MVSCPDICFAVNVRVVSRYLDKFNLIHWQATNSGSDLTAIGYYDSDYAGDIDTRRSTTRYVLKLAGGPVTWLSPRQIIVTLSITEAEYIVACAATKEAIWLSINIYNH